MLALQFFGFRPAMAVYGLCFSFVLMLYLLLHFNVSFIFEQAELEASSVSGLGCFRHVFSALVAFACAHHQLVFSGPIAWVLLMVAAWQSRRLVRQVCTFRNDMYMSDQSQINACALRLSTSIVSCSLPWKQRATSCNWRPRAREVISNLTCSR